MLNEVKNKYSATLEYYQTKNYNNELGPIWGGNLPNLQKIIHSSRSAEELIDFIDRTFMFSINYPPENGDIWQSSNDNPRRRERMIDWLLRDMKVREVPDYDIQESPFIHSRNKVYRNNKCLSGNFLRCVSIADRILTEIGATDTVLELGAGCGHLCRTITSLWPCRYFIIDLPETLCFSYTFIKLNFPDKKCLWVTSDEEFSKVDEYDYVFLPGSFAEHLAGKSFDIFINTASMGEMHNTVIREWMNLIQNKLDIKSCFTLNRYLNTISDSTKSARLNQNECSVLYDDRWKIINWELEPSYCRCPYIDTLHSRYVEIIAKRPWNVSQESKRRYADKLYEEVLDEDWVVLDSLYTATMTARDNVLVNDMSMNGTLFKLWESIRLNSTKEKINTMLSYLSRLTRSDATFEEYWYYENLNKIWQNQS